MHLNWKKWQVDFLNTVEAKVIILTWYVKPAETIDLNKVQRSKLSSTFQLMSPLLKSHQSFLQTTRQIDFKFHMETP